MSYKKEKIFLEFVIHSSVSMLYQHISTSTGLSRWFANNVDSTRGKRYFFYWNDSKEKAILLKSEPKRLVRFCWEEDKDTGYFFQMEILADEITNDVSLLVTDFANPEEIESTKRHWKSLVEDLKYALGSV